MLDTNSLTYLSILSVSLCILFVAVFYLIVGIYFVKGYVFKSELSSSPKNEYKVKESNDQLPKISTRLDTVLQTKKTEMPLFTINECNKDKNKSFEASVPDELVISDFREDIASDGPVYSIQDFSIKSPGSTSFKSILSSHANSPEVSLRPFKFITDDMKIQYSDRFTPRTLPSSRENPLKSEETRNFHPKSTSLEEKEKILSSKEF